MSAKLLYVFAFASAAAGSIVLSSFGPQWLPAAWAGVVMLAYLALARVRFGGEVETEEFADNYYYFGFLLTLVALVVVLVRLGDLGDDMLRAVLTQFGLALVTTILGLMVRTALLMGRGGPDAMEERAAARVERAFDDFARSLSRLSAEADSFASGFGGGLRTSLAAVEAHIGDFVVVVTATRDRLTPVHSGLQELATQLEGAAAHLGAAGTRLSAGIDDIGASIHGTVDRVSSALDACASDLGAAGGHFAAEMRSAADRVRVPVSDIGAYVDQVSGGLQAFTSSLTTTASANAQSARDLEQLARSLAAAADMLEKMSASIGLVTAGLESEHREVARLVKEWSAQATEIGEVRHQLVEESTTSREAVAEVRREIAAQIEALVDVLERTTHERGDR